MSRVAVFGGTVEGRILAERLTAFGVTVCAFVATGYGEALIEPCGGLSVKSGRLNREEMTAVFKSEGFDAVVDATHPYAVQVTDNLVSAAREAGVFYLRVMRNQTDYDDVIEAESFEAAVELLNRMDGRVLLTTGSQQLEVFTRVSDFQNRLFVRVLPSADVVKKCEETGFRGRNLICMQGPFTHEINSAMIRMLGIGVVVTKDSGDAGGFPEKLSSARECGAKLIVIRRPTGINETESVSAEAALDILKNRLKPQEHAKQIVYPRFPLFIQLERKNVLIIGGGTVAARRAGVLLEFGAAVTVISPEISPTLRGILDRIIWKPELCRGIDGDYALVIAATGDRSVNKQIGATAKKMGIPVSVADSKEESTFWFPAIARDGGIIAGLVSESGNHGAVKKAAEKVRKSLGGNL